VTCIQYWSQIHEGKSALGKHRRGWKNVIKMDLKIISSVRTEFDSG
jgi:hypothetical protein